MAETGPALPLTVSKTIDWCGSGAGQTEAGIGPERRLLENELTAAAVWGVFETVPAGW